MSLSLKSRAVHGKCITLGPAYNEQLDAKKSTRYKRVLVITELAVAGLLLVVHCSYQGNILSDLMSINH